MINIKENKRSDGSLLAFLRPDGSINKIFKAISIDGGETWSSLRKSHLLDKERRSTAMSLIDRILTTFL